MPKKMILEKAVEYATLGYKVFPLASRLKRPHGALVPHGVSEASDDVEKVRGWFTSEPSANLGLACTGLIVIDCDTGNTWPGFERLKAGNHAAVQNTPSGGMHFLFRLPQGKAWKNSTSRLAHKIDTRSDGGHIVVEPSRTVKSAEGKTVSGDYFFEKPLPPFAELPYPPEWLVEELDRCFASNQTVNCETPSGQLLLPAPSSTDIVDRAKAYLDACDPAISGQGGHNQTFSVAQSLVNGFCLESEVALRLLLENYNPRCEPPWSENELRHKVDSALQNPPEKPRNWLRNEGFVVQKGLENVDISGIVEEAQKPTSLVVVPDEPSDRAYEFIDATLFEPCPPDWLLHGTLERDTLALVFGDPGCGKTFMAFDWAARIATGTPWRGHEVKAAPVFYVAGEGRRGLGRRIRAWEQHNGVKIARGSMFIGPAVAVTDVRQLSELIAAIDAQKKPGLIVLDTLARCFGGGDENATQDMSRFVAACDVLRNYYGCTILIVHHTGHTEKGRARGAMALNAALDAEYRLNRSESGLTLTATKLKDADPPTPLGMNLVSVKLPNIEDEYGNPVASAAIDVMDADVGAILSTATAGCEQERTAKHCRQM